MTSTTSTRRPTPPPVARPTAPRRARGPRPPGRPGARVPLLVGPGADRPDADRARVRARTSGTSRTTATSTSPPSWSTSTSATSTRKLVAAIQEQAGRLCTIVAGVRQRRALRGGAADRRARARATSTWSSSPTAAPRRTRTPSAWPACTPAGTRSSRPTAATTAPTAGAIALTGEPRRWPTEPGMPGVVRFWGPYLYRSLVPCRRPRRRSASGRWRTCADVIAFEGAAHRRRDRPGDRGRAPTGSSFRRTATSPACARSATSSAS